MNAECVFLSSENLQVFGFLTPVAYYIISFLGIHHLLTTESIIAKVHPKSVPDFCLCSKLRTGKLISYACVITKGLLKEAYWLVYNSIFENLSE